MEGIGSRMRGKVTDDWACEKTAERKEETSFRGPSLTFIEVAPYDWKGANTSASDASNDTFPT